MKIAAICCSGGLNIGNEFINAGGLHLLRRFFPEAEIFRFEFFDSCLGEDFQYPSPPLTPSAMAFINDCDQAFLFGGSILSIRTIEVLRQISRLKVPVTLLGAGCWQFNQQETEVCREVADLFPAIWTRDHVSLENFAGAANARGGIDLAFFAGDALSLPREPGGYAVINLDMIRQHRKEIDSQRKKLVRDYDDVFVTENTHTVYKDVPGYLFMSYWQTFYTLYANAAFVLTNRIHTSVVSLSNAVPFRYEGVDQGGKAGRNTLFGPMDFTLKQGTTYGPAEVAACRPKIQAVKERFLQAFGDSLATCDAG
ncbi:MAG: polysaccharide pyruvyl transferase family protein [Opitutales bacterium]